MLPPAATCPSSGKRPPGERARRRRQRPRGHHLSFTPRPALAAPELLGQVVGRALRRGVILLPGGMHVNVISLGPPFTATEAQLEAAAGAIDAALRACRK